MNPIHFFILCALPVFSASSFAISDSINNQFKKIDRNKDGFLTRSEASIDPALWSKFIRYDQDKDGKLTLSEYHLYASK